jgi:hypothetical protein
MLLLTKLQDEAWTIRTIPLVLGAGADEYGIKFPSMDYSVAELRQIIQRYNGYGQGAVEYGQRVHYVYTLFEKVCVCYDHSASCLLTSHLSITR